MTFILLLFFFTVFRRRPRVTGAGQFENPIYDTPSLPNNPTSLDEKPPILDEKPSIEDLKAAEGKYMTRH